MADVSGEVSQYLSEIGRRGGKIGGKRAAEKLTPVNGSVGRSVLAMQRRRR
jgi:hypothetical protein